LLEVVAIRRKNAGQESDRPKLIVLVVAKQPEKVTVVIAVDMKIENQTWGKFLALELA
jgi:hypothetical protein